MVKPHKKRKLNLEEKRDKHEDFWNEITSYDTQVFSVFADKDADNPIFEYLDSKPQNLTVADLGCGSGNFLPFLSKRFEKVIAGDYSDSLLKQAEEAHAQLTNVEYKNIDMRDLEPLYEKLDVAVSVNSVLPEAVTEVDKMFEEIYKSIKPGGELVAILPAAEAAIHLATLEYQKLLDGGVEESEATKRIEKTFHEDRQFSVLGLQRDNKTVPRQKYHFGFEIPWRLEKAGFKSVELKKVYYSWGYTKDHDYGYFPGSERIWDWFVVAKK